MAFIIKPLVTEKMTKITDKQPSRYGFLVRPEANKLEIKKRGREPVQCYGVRCEYGALLGQAFESLYKSRSCERPKKNAFKKAIVTLKDGDMIDFYSNL